MYKIGILEDEANQARSLTDFLERYAQTHPSFTYTVKVWPRAFDLLDGYTQDFDLLFLDIRLPDMLGMEAARRIREQDKNVMMIFVTNLTQYAIEGYSVQAFDYVLKPVAYDAFAVKLERALRVLSYRQPEATLVVKTRAGSLRLTAAMILYLEVSNHDILIHTDSQVIKQWGTLSRFEEQLKNAHFVRCNASFLVNLKYVAGVYGDQVQVGGTRLPIGKTRRKEFLTALAQYKGGSG